MNRTVNKFGHYRGFQNKVGPPGVGFLLNADGNYDIQNKILSNVKDPVSDNDATTKKFVRKMCPYFIHSKKSYSVSGRLSDLKNPEHSSDAVNLSYLKEQSINRIEKADFWDAKNIRIKSLGEPVEEGDGVHLNCLNEKIKELRKNVINLEENSQKFDCNGKIVSNVGVAEKDDEVVNLKLLNKLLKLQAFLIMRNLTDAVIHLRREVYNVNKVKHKPEEVDTHLNSIENSFKRTWRMAVQSDKPQPPPDKKFKFSDKDKSDLYKHLQIEEHHLEKYLQQDEL